MIGNIMDLSQKKDVQISGKQLNDNIHKNEVQERYDQTNIDKYRVAANITENYIISKLNFQNS